MSDTTMTAEPGAIFKALCSAQVEFKPLQKNRDGYTRANGEPTYFRYADLDELIRATRHALATNGLAVFQTTKGSVLTTTLAHASGQTLTSEATLPVSTSLMDSGASLTLLRRQQYAAILCLPTGDDSHPEQEARDVPQDWPEITEPVVLPTPVAAVQSARPPAPQGRTNPDNTWCDEALARQLEKMGQMITSGRQTVDGVIGTLQSLADLRNDQIEHIRSLWQPPADDEALHITHQVDQETGEILGDSQGAGHE